MQSQISQNRHFRQNCYFLRDPFCHDFFFPSFIPLLYKSFYLHSTASHVCSILHVAVRYVNPTNLKITQKSITANCKRRTILYSLWIENFGSKVSQLIPNKVRSLRQRYHGGAARIYHELMATKHPFLVCFALPWMTLIFWWIAWQELIAFK